MHTYALLIFLGGGVLGSLSLSQPPLCNLKKNNVRLPPSFFPFSAPNKASPPLPPPADLQVVLENISSRLIEMRSTPPAAPLVELI